MTLLELRNLSKRFGSTPVVDGVSLRVSEGEFVTLLGPSGCGKTTTLRMIAGFLEPDGGEVHVGGKLVSSASFTLPPEKRQMGMVFQSYALWPHMTVFDNLAYALQYRKLPAQEIRRRVQEALAMVGLEQMEKRYPLQLSGGQQQRVALARALATEPKLLLMDEPLSNLDAKLRDRMRLEIKALHARLGLTIIYVTHDQAEAMVISDRIAVMNGGRMEQIGRPAEIYESPRNRVVADFIGRMNFVQGKVLGDVGGFLLVDSDAGVRLRGRAVAPVREGESAWVAVRPERIRTSPHPSAETLRGTVEALAYQGNLVTYHVRVAAHLLEVEGGPGEVLTPGQEVHLQLDPAHTLVYNE